MWGRKKRTAELPVKPEPGEVTEAAKNPGGRVYRISGNYAAHEGVPPEAIVGAWKVNETGIIDGPFMPNPNFAPSSPAANKT